MTDPKTSAAQKNHAQKRGLILMLWACRNIPQFGNDPYDDEYDNPTLHRIGTAGYELLDAEGDVVALAADQTWATVLAYMAGEDIKKGRNDKSE